MFKGCGTALITPFKNGAVDYVALEGLINQQLDGGIDALIVCGTTGEPATMSWEEREKVVDFCIAKVNKRVPVYVGTGSNSTELAIKCSKSAAKAGADGLLVVTPYYNKCTQNGLIAHYTAIAKAVDLPIIMYNVPSRTGVNLLPATAAKLAEVENIVAVKEASGNIDQICELCRLSRGKLTVYSGDDGITVPMMALGAAGVISVASNVLPRYMHDMTAAFFAGEIDRAAKMQLDVSPLVKLLFCEVNPIPVKRAAAFLGLCENELRLPLTAMEPDNEAKLKQAMKEFGLL